MTTTIKDRLYCWFDFVVDRTGRSDIYDFSGNGHDAILSNTDGFSWDTNKHQLTIEPNRHLKIAYDKMINNTSVFTLHANITTITPYSGGIIYLQQHGGAGDFGLISNNSIYKIFYRYASTVDAIIVDTNIPVVINESNYITMIINYSTKNIKLYFNGILAITVNITQTIGSILCPNIVLNYAGASTKYADVRFYERELSAEEIYNLVHRKTFIDNLGRVYSKSFNTNGVTTPKVKETGIDYASIDGSKANLNLSQGTLTCNGIEAI